jgi:hypothetical protein
MVWSGCNRHVPVSHNDGRKSGDEAKSILDVRPAGWRQLDTAALNSL